MIPNEVFVVIAGPLPTAVALVSDIRLHCEQPSVPVTVLASPNTPTNYEWVVLQTAGTGGAPPLRIHVAAPRKVRSARSLWDIPFSCTAVVLLPGASDWVASIGVAQRSGVSLAVLTAGLSGEELSSTRGLVDPVRLADATPASVVGALASLNAPCDTLVANAEGALAMSVLFHFKKLGVTCCTVLRGTLRPDDCIAFSGTFTAPARVSEIRAYPTGEVLAAAGPGCVVTFALTGPAAQMPNHTVVGAADPVSVPLPAAALLVRHDGTVPAAGSPLHITTHGGTGTYTVLGSQGDLALIQTVSQGTCVTPLRDLPHLGAPASGAKAELPIMAFDSEAGKAQQMTAVAVWRKMELWRASEAAMKQSSGAASAAIVAAVEEQLVCTGVLQRPCLARQVCEDKRLPQLALLGTQDALLTSSAKLHPFDSTSLLAAVAAARPNDTLFNALLGTVAAGSETFRQCNGTRWLRGADTVSHGLLQQLFENTAKGALNHSQAIALMTAMQRSGGTGTASQFLLRYMEGSAKPSDAATVLFGVARSTQATLSADVLRAVVKRTDRLPPFALLHCVLQAPAGRPAFTLSDAPEGGRARLRRFFGCAAHDSAPLLMICRRYLLLRIAALAPSVAGKLSVGTVERIAAFW